MCCVVIYEQLNDEVLRFMPEGRAEAIGKELKKFERFPKEVRITMALKLLGHLTQHVQNPHLEMIHPTWIAGALEKEDPQIVFDLLDQFPGEYAGDVLQCLGNAAQPIANPLAAIPTETVQVILRLLAQRFESMAAPLGELELTLDTLYLLREVDLITIMKHIGILEIARAFIRVGRDVLTALVTRFPEDMREDFLNAMRTAQEEPTEKQKIATRRISKIDLPSHPIEYGTLQVGLMKAGSVLNQHRESKRKIAQRLPKNLGQILLLADSEEEAAAEEKDEIMNVISGLIARNKIDRDYIRTRFSSSASERMSFRMGT